MLGTGGGLLLGGVIESGELGIRALLREGEPLWLCVGRAMKWKEILGGKCTP